MTSDLPEATEKALLSPEERFVEFQYEQMKDLTKHFLTLIAGTLVLTVSFAEKIVPLANAPQYQKALLAACFVSLFVAFALAGTGLAGIFLAAVAAREGKVWSWTHSYSWLARRSYIAIDIGGIFFVLALAFLALLGVLRLI